MTSRDFCFWLQGYIELSLPQQTAAERAGRPLPYLNHEQTECVRRHLALVFKHEIDPSLALLTNHAETMQKIHDGQNWDVTGPQIRC